MFCSLKKGSGPSDHNKTQGYFWGGADGAAYSTSLEPFPAAPPGPHPPGAVWTTGGW